MALPTFDKQSDIPKGFEDEYEESDGKWVPVDRTAALQNALAKEREAREAAEKLAKKAAREAAEMDAKKTASAAGMTDDELKKLYQKIEGTIRAEYEPQIQELETARRENRELKLNNVVKAKLREQGALANRLDDFWKLHGEEFDLTADGKPMVKAEPGKDVTKHVAALMKARPEWVQGTKAAGSGAGYQSTTQPQSQGPMTFDDMVRNPTAGIAAANER